MLNISSAVNDSIAIDPRNVRDISQEVLDEQGVLKVLPAAYWKSTTVMERALFGHKSAYYCFPTTELVGWLKAFVGPLVAVEVGCGAGVLGKAVDIPCTDSMLQNDERVKQLYALTGHAPVSYGRHVQKLEATQAAGRFKAQVVIAAWLTHRFNPKHEERGGNMFGPDDAQLLRSTKQLVLICNEHVHRNHSILHRPHARVYPDWLVSRAHNGTREFIAVFGPLNDWQQALIAGTATE